VTEQERILVVDDEESVRNLIQRTLQEAGFNVVSVTNGQEALDTISQMNIELVLLDIKMPGMSGLDVLDKLRDNWPDIAVIMATAVGDAQTAVDTMKRGAYDYLTKPFNRDDLVLKVQRAFEKKLLQHENERYRLDIERRVAEQAGQLKQQFSELVETLAREHKLLYKLAHNQKGGKEMLSKLPPELQTPMSSVEEFSEALLKILRKAK